MAARHDRGQPRRRLRIGRIIGLLLLVSVVAGLGVGAGLVLAALRSLPELAPTPPSPQMSSIIYDRYGQPVTTIFATQDRTWTHLGDLPRVVPEAFLAVEDRRFYQHHGIDVVRTLGALVHDLRGGSLQGGSTITQQLARNLYAREVGTERTLDRKIREAVTAVALERQYSKQQILEMYLNLIYFGHAAYGIEAASRAYFDVDAKHLTLAQAATLAALPKAPNLYEPIGHPQAALDRRNLVLDEMAEAGFITADQAEEAKRQPLGVHPARRIVQKDYPDPWFVDYVIDQLRQHGYSWKQVYEGGLRIYTTLDPRIDQEAQKIVTDNLRGWYPPARLSRPIQAAAVLMDPQTGEILAMVGGLEHTTSRGNNWAVLPNRPGSAIKPIAVYVPALSQGVTAASVFDDAPVTFPRPGQRAWTPQNFESGQFMGLTTVREAVRRSVNVVAVRVLDAIGVDKGYAMARALGLESLTPQDRTLALALGGLTRGVTPLEMAVAYSTIANGGLRPQPLAIRKVVTADGKVLEENQPSLTRVISPQVAYVMTDILRSVVEDLPANGFISPGHTGGAAKIPGWPTAGKTGTDENYVNAWFAGFTPRLTGIVWVGHEGHLSPLPGNMQGGSSRGPAALFRMVMSAALRGQKPVDFPRPSGLVSVRISAKSGKVAGPLTPDRWARDELFIAGTQPAELDDAFYQAEVCADQPGLLYQPGCACTPVTKLFLRRPPAQAADMSMTAPTASCNGAPAAGSPPPDQGAAGTPPTPPGDASPSGPSDAVDLQITGTGWSPAAFQLKAGLGLLHVRNTTDQEHELVVDGLQLDVKIPAGESTDVPVRIERPGTYTFHCALHPGEQGAITVTP
ncbi:MAG: PBP1A family penicillin-binding protein [Bacillota bacterium]|nr:PBP1A family penicillin-binding protein [Bacillota bacterium]